MRKPALRLWQIRKSRHAPKDPPEDSPDAEKPDDGQLTVYDALGEDDPVKGGDGEDKGDKGKTVGEALTEMIENGQGDRYPPKGFERKHKARL